MGRPTIEQLQTKLVLAADVLHRAEQRAIVGRVMHDIRNPIEALGYLRGADDPEKVRECMRLADEQTRSLTKLPTRPSG